MNATTIAANETTTPKGNTMNSVDITPIIHHAAIVITESSHTGWWNVSDVERDGGVYTITWQYEENTGNYDFYANVREFARVEYEAGTALEDVDFADLAAHFNYMTQYTADERCEHLNEDALRNAALEHIYLYAESSGNDDDAQVWREALRSAEIEFVFEPYSWWTAERVEREYREYYEERAADEEDE